MARPLPPFSQGSVHCGPHHRAWVERIVEPGAPPRVDVFNEAGARVHRFDLPIGVRIVGFGRHAVYVVHRDEFDLEHLMRLGVPEG